MITIVIPGGGEADSRPDGRYVSFVKHQHGCWTEWGFLPNPPHDEVRWPVLSHFGGRIACQGQNDPPKGWEFDLTAPHPTPDALWKQIPAPCGVWPVIYDHANTLHISQCQPGVGSQGWRYVALDGHLVTGDATVLVRNGLNEWTDLSLAQSGSLLVGQDNSGAGVGVWAAGKRRLLTPGACYNVRAAWDGAIVSVSCYNVQPDGIETRFFWLTMAELCALPVLA